MRAVRWALAGPGAIAAWYATFLVGIVTHGIVESALCPAGEMVSGMCANGKVQAQLEALIYVFVAISAVAVVTAAVLIAPSHKHVVAWVTFTAGGLVACLFAVAADALGEGISAVASGLLVTLAIDSYSNRLTRRANPPPTNAT